MVAPPDYKAEAGARDSAKRTFRVIASGFYLNPPGQFVMRELSAMPGDNAVYCRLLLRHPQHVAHLHTLKCKWRAFGRII